MLVLNSEIFYERRIAADVATKTSSGNTTLIAIT